MWNNNFLIYSGTAGITGGNNVANRFVLVNNPSFSGKIIGGSNSTNILDLSQLTKEKVIGVNVDYRFKPSAYGRLKVKINSRLLIDDYVSNNLFNYHYVGRKDKVDKILCGNVQKSVSSRIFSSTQFSIYLERKYQVET
ncbi:hypothetical protein [Wolbachia endosymbiont (group B) of Endotricha flammealis]|uniref:hypothetical protein n=1 Tax=Wolbachia endosymbiont (group B) of Endotricha flammealis TaxID=2954005 RepID=UPI00223287C6|nr:hypothetical protein [Wolbachia endosymbiont (group B) of Endotricha flammealis]